MKVLSVNAGLPREVSWKGQVVTTGIFKEPVTGPVPLRRLNLDGDRQADLSVHGGPDKAVYAYPSEHYGYWHEELADPELPWGMFGENLTIEGLPLEDEIFVGDRFRVGSAELVVTQPRLPCYKLGIRFGRQDMVKRFLHSGRTGFYFAVAEEGTVRTGDAVTLLERDRTAIPVAEITRLYAFDRDDVDALRRVLEAEALPESWRRYFERQLAEAAGRPRAAGRQAPANGPRTSRRDH